VQDLGSVAIVPGLVNAHTHLEFSGIERPLGSPHMPLPDWIRRVIAERRAANDQQHNIRLGLAECRAAATTTLGEIATTDWRAQVNDASLRVVMFREAIAPLKARVAPTLATIDEFLQASSTNLQVSPALSPHAPYTVHRELLAGLIERSVARQLPLAMHLAESPEELELLATGTGPFRELLVDLSAGDDDPQARYPTCREYLEQLARAPRALVIHGNYLHETDHVFLAGRRATMSVVYCPRTHAYFGHAPYPLAQMLAKGVLIALGTDSRASNPDLNLLAEMKHVARQHPDVSGQTILELGTLAGARALGVDNLCGTIEPSKVADLAVVAIDPAGQGGDPHELLFSDESQVVETILAGRRRVSS
jgi:cytosine/adenosine deaminase-related metal-dependent hydrolase